MSTAPQQHRPPPPQARHRPSPRWTRVATVATLAVLLVLITAIAYHERVWIATALQQLAHFLIACGAWGPLISMLLVAVTAFPPVIGFAVLLTMNGFVYGVALGFAVNFCGALSGAVACFAVSRRWRSSERSDTSGTIMTSGARQRARDYLRVEPAMDDQHDTAMPLRALSNATSGTGARGQDAATAVQRQDSATAIQRQDSTTTSQRQDSTTTSQRQDSTTTSQRQDTAETGIAPSSPSLVSAHVPSRTPAQTQAAMHSHMPTRPSQQTPLLAPDGSKSPPSLPYASTLHALDRYLVAHPEQTFRLVLMLRLAPYPFNVMSALLGQVRVVSARTHALATALSLCKIVLHTWTGSLLEELSQVITGPGHDDDDGGWTTARVSELCALVMAIGLAVASGIYVYRVVLRALAECREDREEEEEVAIEVPVINTV